MTVYKKNKIFFYREATFLLIFHLYYKESGILLNEPENIISFTLIYNKYKKGLYYYVYKSLNCAMASEDIVQNVFLKLFENLNKIKNKNAVGGWIFKTAQNEIYQKFRDKARDKEVEAYDENSLKDGKDLMTEIEEKELKSIIENELNKIPADQREVFILREYSGLSYKEIADIMEIDENTIKSRLYHTRQKLIDRISRIVKS